jgi:hypothetical protein
VTSSLHAWALSSARYSSLKLPGVELQRHNQQRDFEHHFTSIMDAHDDIIAVALPETILVWNTVQQESYEIPFGESRNLFALLVHPLRPNIALFYYEWPRLIFKLIDSNGKILRQQDISFADVKLASGSDRPSTFHISKTSFNHEYILYADKLYTRFHIIFDAKTDSLTDVSPMQGPLWGLHGILFGHGQQLTLFSPNGSTFRWKDYLIEINPLGGSGRLLRINTKWTAENVLPYVNESGFQSRHLTMEALNSVMRNTHSPLWLDIMYWKFWESPISLVIGDENYVVVGSNSQIHVLDFTTGSH